MAKTTGKSGRTQESPAAAGFEALFHENHSNLSAAMKAQESLLHGVAALNQEIMEFASARFREDVAASEKLMNSKDAESAFCAQCEFAQSAIQQYFMESTKLMGLATQIARDCWTPLQDRSRLVLRNLNGG